MGYNLDIGELEVEFEQDDCYISLTAKSESRDDAPAYGEPTDNSNSRWPSYTSWHNSMEFVGLKDLFFDEDSEYSLLTQHPGCVPLNKHHKKVIDRAYEDFMEKYPDVVAGYSPKTKDNIMAEDPDWPEENGALVRLEWLKYWVDWALKNCEKPVFANS